MKCSYVETIAKGQQIPSWFVSHLWGESVFDFVKCVKQYAEDHDNYSLDDVHYWICAYANNQHDLGASNSDYPEILSFTMKAIVELADYNKALSIVDPEATRKFTRIWCCLEIFMGLRYRKKHL